MSYVIMALPDVEDDLDAIDRPQQMRIRAAIRELAGQPRPPGTVKLSDLPDAYRIRIGSYRVVYRILDKQLQVMLIVAAKRGEVYSIAKRRLKRWAKKRG